MFDRVEFTLTELEPTHLRVMTDQAIPQTETNLLTKLNVETAKINWSQLQRFFASGEAIFVDASLDLVEIGQAVAEDNVSKLAPYSTQKLVAPVTEAQAQQWYDNDQVVWALVIAPLVLVQVPK